jgi:hypothetical protein
MAAAVALIAFLALQGKGGSSSRSAAVTTTTVAAVEDHAGPLLTAPKRDQAAGKIATTRKAAAAWTSKFRASDDYLQFVIDALPAARSGDGRAALYIGEALKSCALVMKTYRGSTDPDAQLNQELANMPKAPQWTRDLLAQKTRRCLGLAHEDPFKGLPPRDGGYMSSSYWRDQAVAAGDPVAQEQTAQDEVVAIASTPSLTEGEKTETLKTAQGNVQTAIESRDPDALYDAGILLSDQRYSSNPSNGIALALASCELGRDCSADNPENSFFNCKLSGACPANADFAYLMQQSLGPDAYAQIYAHAQEIKQMIEAGEWDALLPTLKLDKHP